MVLGTYFQNDQHMKVLLVFIPQTILKYQITDVFNLFRKNYRLHYSHVNYNIYLLN